jgi:hypothetical protein
VIKRKGFLAIVVSSLLTLFCLELGVRLFYFLAPTRIVAFKDPAWLELNLKEPRYPFFRIPEEYFYWGSFFTVLNSNKKVRHHLAGEYDYEIHTEEFFGFGKRVDQISKDAQVIKFTKTDPKPENWIIGDSFAFGFGVPDWETVSSILNSKGHRSANLGVSGASPWQYMQMMEYYLENGAQRPKNIVFMVFEGNDLPFPIVNNEAMCCSIFLRIADSFEYRVLHLSELYNFINERLIEVYNRKIDKGDFVRPDPIDVPEGVFISDNGYRNNDRISVTQWSQFLKVFKTITDQKFSDINFFIYLIPTKAMTFNLIQHPSRLDHIDGFAQDFLKVEFLKRDNIKVVNLLPEIVQDKEFWYFKKDPHFNPYGYRQLARVIERDLIAK